LPKLPHAVSQALLVRALTHRYPGADRPALSDVSLDLEFGACLGLLGPNGAGKTTLMRILCGYLPVRGGLETRVRVAGHDVRTDSLSVRRRVGYLPEQVPLYTELKVHEHLAFRAAIKGVPRRRVQREIERVCERTGVFDKLQIPIQQLSRGYRQRVGIADALLGEPVLVVLDEPTVGLDPNQVVEMRTMLRSLVGHQTLVFSSHILAEVELICDRVAILSHGRVVADESLDDALRSSAIIGVWQASTAAVQQVVNEAWMKLALTSEAPRVVTRPHGPRVDGNDPANEETEGTIPIATGEREHVDDLLRALGCASRDRGLAVLRLQPGQTRLEQRFAEVTGASRSEVT